MTKGIAIGLVAALALTGMALAEGDWRETLKSSKDPELLRWATDRVIAVWPDQDASIRDASIRALCGHVEMGEGAVRRRAAETLARLVHDRDSARAWRGLIGLLKSTNSASRGAAAYQVAGLGSQALTALPVLRAKLFAKPRTKGDLCVAYAVERLSGHCAPARVALLDALQAAPQAKVRRHAAQLAGELWSQAGAAKRRAERGGVAPVVSALRRALQDPETRGGALIALGEIGERAASTRTDLVKLVRNDRYRLSVVQALGNMGSQAADQLPVVLPLFEAALRGETPREPAPWFLGPLAAMAPDDPRVMRAIEAALKSQAVRLRLCALKGLARQTHPKAHARIARAFREEGDEELKAHLVVAYGDQVPHAPEAHAFFAFVCAQDASASVRAAAARALAQSPPAFRAKAIATLRTRLKQDTSGYVRGLSARSLAALRATNALSDVIKALDDRPALRSVLQALAEFGPAAKRALPLIETLSTITLEGDDLEGPRIRIEAVRALRKIR